MLECIKVKNIGHTRGIMPKRVTSGEANPRSLAPGQHSSKEISRWWPSVGVTVSDVTSSGIKPQTSRTDSRCFQQLRQLAGY